jgi:hypothetical protein
VSCLDGKVESAMVDRQRVESRSAAMIPGDNLAVENAAGRQFSRAVGQIAAFSSGTAAAAD